MYVRLADGRRDDELAGDAPGDKLVSPSPPGVRPL